MSVQVEFFFDLSSPWSRLAFHNIDGVLADAEVRLIWRPFLVGGVFNAVNDSVYATRANPEDPKTRMNFVWLREWATLAGVSMNFPSSHHPLKSVQAMRCCCALEEDQEALRRFSHAAFEAYCTHKRNLDDANVLSEIADAVGLNGARLLEAARTQRVKDLLRANTQEAIDRGAFGSPTIFVDRQFMYFGNDQLPLVRQRILAIQAQTRSRPTSS